MLNCIAAVQECDAREGESNSTVDHKTKISIIFAAFMKGISFLHPALYVDKTKDMGRGVFTSEPLEAGTVIEISPVIAMSGKDWKLLDQTLLHDYIFKWGKAEKQCCMALGYVPLYNHSYRSNCDYQMNFRQQLIAIITIQPVAAGAELLINYNGEANDATPLWFDAK